MWLVLRLCARRWLLAARCSHVRERIEDLFSVPIHRQSCGRPCRAITLELSRLCSGLLKSIGGSTALAIMSLAFEHENQRNPQSASLVSQDGHTSDYIGAVSPTSQAAVTLITAYDPVTKHFSLSDDNRLQKCTSAQLSEADLLGSVYIC